MPKDKTYLLKKRASSSRMSVTRDPTTICSSITVNSATKSTKSTKLDSDTISKMSARPSKKTDGNSEKNSLNNKEEKNRLKKRLTSMHPTSKKSTASSKRPSRSTTEKYTNHSSDTLTEQDSKETIKSKNTITKTTADRPTLQKETITRYDIKRESQKTLTNVPAANKLTLAEFSLDLEDGNHVDQMRELMKQEKFLQMVEKKDLQPYQSHKICSQTRQKFEEVNFTHRKGVRNKEDLAKTENENLTNDMSNVTITDPDKNRIKEKFQKTKSMLKAQIQIDRNDELLKQYASEKFNDCSRISSYDRTILTTNTNTINNYYNNETPSMLTSTRPNSRMQKNNEPTLNESMISTMTTNSTVARASNQAQMEELRNHFKAYNLTLDEINLKIGDLDETGTSIINNDILGEEEGPLNDPENLEKLMSCIPRINFQRETSDDATAEDQEIYVRHNLTKDGLKNRKIPNNIAKLPIYEKREEIIKMVETNLVTVIRGETGSGKTTQVPQFILEQAAIENRHCNIIVTQPRKLATISVAQRICGEREWNEPSSDGENGSIVGHQVGLDRAVGPDTRLTFMTTGVLLRILINKRSLQDFTHIIIDEVHERDIDIDMLLLCIKFLMRGGTKCRIILMSATMETREFVDYFTMIFQKDVEKAKKQREEQFQNNGDELKTLNVQDLIQSNIAEIKIDGRSYPVQNVILNHLDSRNPLELKFLPKEMNTMIDVKNLKLKVKPVLERHQMEKHLFLQDHPSKNMKRKIETANFRDQGWGNDGDNNPDKNTNQDLFWQQDINRIEEITVSDASFNLALDIIYTLIPRIEQKIKKSTKYTKEKFKHSEESILIFLPGIYEIRTLEQMIRNRDEKQKRTTVQNRNFMNETENTITVPEHKCYTLHSSISIKEQRRIFEKVGHNECKVILATNIAESSITVPDVRYIIDFCLTKEMIADKMTTYQCLKMKYASKAQLKQRSGRAGRTKPGVCFQLISQDYMQDLGEFPIPAIRRQCLEGTVLQVKSLRFNDSPKSILRKAITPPKAIDVERAIVKLKQLGGLTYKMVMNGKLDYENGHVTFLGKIMETLPLDIRLSRLIFMGYCLGPIYDCITMAACLSVQNFWLQPYDRLDRIESLRSMLRWDAGSGSDAIAMMNAYRAYEKNKDGKQERNMRWCNNHQLDVKKMMEINRLFEEIELRLSNLHIDTRQQEFTKSKEEHELILKICLAGAFYPNFMETEPLNLKDATTALSDNDPYTSVNLELRGHSKLPSQSLVSPIIKSLSAYGLVKKLIFTANRCVAEFRYLPGGVSRTNFRGPSQNHRNENAYNRYTRGKESYPKIEAFQSRIEPIKILLSEAKGGANGRDNRFKLEIPKLTEKERQKLNKTKATQAIEYLQDKNTSYDEVKKFDYSENLHRNTIVHLHHKFTNLKSVVDNKIDVLRSVEYHGNYLPGDVENSGQATGWSGNQTDGRKSFLVYITEFRKFPRKYILNENSTIFGRGGEGLWVGGFDFS